MVGVIDLGLVGLYMRDVFSVEPIAEKGLTLGAAASSGAARFYIIKKQKIKIMIDPLSLRTTHFKEFIS